MEPQIDVGVMVELGPAGLGQRMLPPRTRFRYKHVDRPLLLQLVEGAFTVSVLPPYPGRQAMLDAVVDAWKKASEVLRPELIHRMGLRYINRIPRQESGERASAWLKPSPYIPQALLESYPDFLYRLEVRPDPGHRIVVTVGDTPEEGDSGLRDFIFDIERMVEQEMPADPVRVMQEMNVLHDHVWEVFESARSGRLERFLCGGEPKCPPTRLHR